jgi:hypothetical protein
MMADKLCERQQMWPMRQVRRHALLQPDDNTYKGNLSSREDMIEGWRGRTPGRRVVMVVR